MLSFVLFFWCFFVVVCGVFPVNFACVFFYWFGCCSVLLYSMLWSLVVYFFVFGVSSVFFNFGLLIFFYTCFQFLCF